MKVINDTIHGAIEVSGISSELLATPALERLSRISQGGSVFLSYPNIKTSRLEHSIGVYLLIDKLGGSEKECIAGLLHDISHSAFSHVIDYVVGNHLEDYHENCKEVFLRDESLMSVLDKYGYSYKDFLSDEDFNILEAPLPYLCADRIDYTLRDMLIWGSISLSEAESFIKNLIFIDGRIVVKSRDWAVWFQNLYTELNEYFFRDPKNVYAANEFTALIRLARDENIITLEDFHQDDQYVLALLEKSLKFKNKLENIKSVLKEDKYTSHIVGKFKKRWVDPLVLVDSRVVLLSEL